MGAGAADWPGKGPYRGRNAMKKLVIVLVVLLGLGAIVAVVLRATQE
jgi:hypothetical protein